MRGNDKVLQLLLRHGGDPTKTPTHVAAMRGNDEVLCYTLQIKY